MSIKCRTGAGEQHQPYRRDVLAFIRPRGAGLSLPFFLAHRSCIQHHLAIIHCSVALGIHEDGATSGPGAFVGMSLHQQLTRSLQRAGRCSQCLRLDRQQRASSSRTFSTATRRAGIAAPEIDLSQLPQRDSTKARIVPLSPSYFSSQPRFTDNLVQLQTLIGRYGDRPTLAPAAAPRITWKSLMQYRRTVGENVRESRYKRIRNLLTRLNLIHPSLRPDEVVAVIERHKRDLDPLDQKRRPQIIDEFGRAYANGRRKTSRANVLLVEGDGQILINGRSIVQHFGRVHDRESAVWPLKITNRLDKYNVWATVHGGGTTGQAESLTLAVAKALLVHEPALKPTLRRGTTILSLYLHRGCMS